MTISLVEVTSANFRTDYDSDRLNTDFMRRLGMSKRYLPARLAISRSLSMPEPIELLELQQGKAITGDTLFGTGTELSVWLALISEHAGEQDLNTKRLVALVGAHWRRGLLELDKLWRQAEGDFTYFVRRLVDVAELSTAADHLPARAGASGATIAGGEIRVPMGEIGEDTTTKEQAL